MLDRAEPVYLFLCAVAAVVVLARAFGEITSLTGRRQLRWIAWGTVLGVGPFAFGYALPWALGSNPPLALQLTAIPLGLVPLAFASAIVRYRLRDVEVIIKRGVGYTAFLGASARAVSRDAEGASASCSRTTPIRTTGSSRCSPRSSSCCWRSRSREAVQNALDRVFYRDRYDYRRALVGFARDLNSDLDVVRLSQRLVTRIVETLVVDRMALMLADERLGDFRTIGDFGFVAAGAAAAAHRRRSSPRLDTGHTVALDDPIAAAWFAAEEVEFWRDQGIYYFVPCMFEGAAIAVLALGRKETDEPFNSEDLGAADGGRRPGRDGDRERPPLSAAAPQGRRTRPDARVQREHPRIARRRPGRVRRGRSDRPLEPRARELLRRDARPRPSGARSPTSSTRRSSRRCAPRARENPRGATLFKVPLTSREPAADGEAEPRTPAGECDGRAAAEPGRTRRRSSGRFCCSRTSPTACGSKSSCRFPRRWRRSVCWRPAWRTR